MDNNPADELHIESHLRLRQLAWLVIFIGMGLFMSAVAELRGMEIAGLTAPEDRDRVMENIRQGLQSVIEHAVLRKDGSRIIVEAHGLPVSPRYQR